MNRSHCVFESFSYSAVQAFKPCVGFTNTNQGELTGPPKRFEWLPWLPPRKVVIGPTKRSQVVLVGYRGFQVGVGGLRWSKPRTPRCSQVAQLGLRLNGWLGLVAPKEGSSWQWKVVVLPKKALRPPWPQALRTNRSTKPGKRKNLQLCSFLSVGN